MTMDFVPEYGFTGKSNAQWYFSSVSSMRIKAARNETTHTHVSHNLIRPRRQLIVVISSPQLRESRQASRAHPVLEVLVRSEVRDVARVVSVREPQSPVRWWCKGSDVPSGSLGILLNLAWPCNVGLRKRVVRVRVDECEVAESV